MKVAKVQPKPPGLSARAEALLLELGEECRQVLKLLAQLEIPALTEAQREAMLGELSAAVLHLHEHTRGLDSIIDGKA